MKRAVIVPPDLSGDPLDALKSWLAISTSHEDGALVDLLGAALDLCEAFIGQTPLQAEYESILPVLARWQTLAARPVVAITAVEGAPVDGERFALDLTDYEIEINPRSEGCVRVLRSIGTSRIAVRYTAGLAVEWGQLPDALKHGIIRLAAASYRSRGEDSVLATMPSAVAALWQPWRQVRLT